MQEYKTMTSDIEQQLKQDGQTIHQQAKLRLADWDVNLSVMQAIDAEKILTQQNSSRSWWYGLAAAIGLTVLLVAFNTTEPDSAEDPRPDQHMVAQPIELNLKQLPLRLEQKVNQPLLDEQQAIIQDLKTLKAELLSI